MTIVKCVFKEEFNKQVHIVNNIQIKTDENTDDISFLKDEIEKLKALLSKIDGPSRGEFDMLR